MPHSGHIKITKPALAEKQSVLIMSSTAADSRITSSWKLVILFPRKIRKRKLTKKRKIESAKADPEDC